jgi:hypothetical protein
VIVGRHGTSTLAVEIMGLYMVDELGARRFHVQIVLEERKCHGNVPVGFRTVP